MKAVAVSLAALAALTAAAPPPHWIGSWAASQQIPEPRNALPLDQLSDATLRQVVHLSAGGPMLRLRLSNAFGTAPLTLDAVHVARAMPGATGAIDPATDHLVRFDGSASVTIPAGADYWSDPIAMAAGPASDIAVSIHMPQPPAQETGHPGSRATSFVIHGDETAASTLTNPTTVEHWYFLDGIEVAAPPAAHAVVALGDSITDGHASTTNGNDRWPDDLARRLQRAGLGSIGVLNEGIGGNRLLLDGLGPNALARFDRDVLAQAGARTLILLEGINDLGTATREHPLSPDEHAALVHAIIAAEGQIIARAHARGLRVIGGTLTPWLGSDYYHPDAAAEADREAVNHWIRHSGAFDAVVDFDRAVRDPANPGHMLASYDSGDHLHPSPAGYRAMAAAIPLALVAR